MVVKEVVLRVFILLSPFLPTFTLYFFNTSVLTGFLRWVPKENCIPRANLLPWTQNQLSVASAPVVRQRYDKICEQMALTTSLFPHVPLLFSNRNLISSHWILKHQVRLKNCTSAKCYLNSDGGLQICASHLVTMMFCKLSPYCNSLTRALFECGCEACMQSRKLRSFPPHSK